MYLSAIQSLTLLLSVNTQLYQEAFNVGDKSSMQLVASAKSLITRFTDLEPLIDLPEDSGPSSIPRAASPNPRTVNIPRPARAKYLPTTVYSAAHQLALQRFVDMVSSAFSRTKRISLIRLYLALVGPLNRSSTTFSRALALILPSGHRESGISANVSPACQPADLTGSLKRLSENKNLLLEIWSKFKKSSRVERRADGTAMRQKVAARIFMIGLRSGIERRLTEGWRLLRMRNIFIDSAGCLAPPLCSGRDSVAQKSDPIRWTRCDPEDEENFSTRNFSFESTVVTLPTASGRDSHTSYFTLKQ